MICPYCDSLLKEAPESGTCPHCCALISTPVQKCKEEKQLPVNLEYYYQKYQNDKVQAIVALRIDTGMDAVSAKQKIDKVFDAHAAEQQNYSHNEEKKKAEKIHCLMCLSTEVKMEPLVGRPRMYTGNYDTPVIKLIASVLKLLAFIGYTTNKERLKYRCTVCDYEWQS